MGPRRWRNTQARASRRACIGSEDDQGASREQKNRSTSCRRGRRCRGVVAAIRPRGARGSRAGRGRDRSLPPGGSCAGSNEARAPRGTRLCDHPRRSRRRREGATSPARRARRCWRSGGRPDARPPGRELGHAWAGGPRIGRIGRRLAGASRSRRRSEQWGLLKVSIGNGARISPGVLNALNTGRRFPARCGKLDRRAPARRAGSAVARARRLRRPSLSARAVSMRVMHRGVCCNWPPSVFGGRTGGRGGEGIHRAASPPGGSRRHLLAGAVGAGLAVAGAGFVAGFGLDFGSMFGSFSFHGSLQPPSGNNHARRGPSLTAVNAPRRRPGDAATPAPIPRRRAKTRTGHLTSERPNGASAPASDAMEVNQRLLGNGSHARFDAFARLVGMGRKRLTFVSRRFDQDRALAASLAAAASPTDLPDIWAEFFETARREYAEETQRLMSSWLDDPAQEASSGAQGGPSAGPSAPQAPAGAVAQR